MNKIYYFILLPIIVSVLCFSICCSRHEPIKLSDSEWGPENKGLRFGLTAEKHSFIYGDPITLTLKIINVSQSVQKYSPEMDLFGYHSIDVKYQDGASLRYSGPMYQGEPPPWIDLPAGQCITKSVRDISEDYQLCEPGKYTIQWDWGYWEIKSNKLEIEIVEGFKSPFYDAACRLIHILPNIRDGWQIELDEANNRYFFRLMTFNEYRTISIWHTPTKVDYASKDVQDNSDELPTEYLGQDKWGYAYIRRRPPEDYSKHIWPTIRQDIINALDIREEKKD